jgi:hypothetical protein
VTAQKFTVQGSKFLGIFGQIDINAPWKDVLSAFIAKETVTKESPLQIQKSMICQKLYFVTKEDELRHNNMLEKKDANESFFFITYNISRSPVPMIVSHRDAVVVSVMRFVTPKKAYLYSIPYDCE